MSRDSDGTLTLGKSMTDLQKAGKSDKQEEQIQRVLKFIGDHPGCQTEEVLKGLAIAKPSFLGIVNTIQGMLTIEGEGKKGDPFRYSLGIYGPPSPA